MYVAETSGCPSGFEEIELKIVRDGVMIGLFETASEPGNMEKRQNETPRFSAAEISAAGVTRMRRGDLGIEEMRLHDLPLISGSDSHSPEEIGGSCTAFQVAELCFAELVLAIQGVGSRGCCIA